MATILRLNKSLLGQMLDVHGPAFIVNNFWEFPSIWDGRRSYTIWKHRNNKNVRTRLIGLLNECDIFRHDKKDKKKSFATIPSQKSYFEPNCYSY